MQQSLKKIKTAILLLTASLWQLLTAQTASDSIDRFVKEKMTQINIPGLQLAVVRNGKLEKLGNYGFASLEHQVATGSKTTFSINSMTKAFVGVAVMQLQEQRKLNVKDPISLYIPDIPDEWKEVRIEQLLSNTSGLPNNIDVKEQVLGDGSENVNWETVKKLPVEFKPGEKFSYNQTGYYILGKIILKVSGEHFTKFIEDHQFIPCSMASTRFGDSNDIIPHNANSYSTIFNNDGKWINDGKLHSSYATFPLFFRSATGIISTAEDLSQWLIALQSGKLLKHQASIDQMLSPALLNNGKIGGFNQLTNGYGLGWPTVTRDGHSAAAPVGGMRSALFLYPKDDLSVVVLTNLQGSNPEWFIDEIAGFYIPDMKVKNGFGLSQNLKLFRQQLIKNNFKDIENIYKRLKKESRDFTVTEDEINSWGYQLSEQNKKNEALQVFRFNTIVFPDSANVYDSYGELLEKLGNRKEAMINYKKSLQLNPDNTNAAEYLLNKK